MKNQNLKEDPKKCNDKRPCFARDGGRCTILRKTYTGKPKLCPFCKPIKNETDGEIYPFDPDYGKKIAEKASVDGNNKGPENNSLRKLIIRGCTHPQSQYITGPLKKKGV